MEVLQLCQGPQGHRAGRQHSKDVRLVPLGPPPSLDAQRRVGARQALQQSLEQERSTKVEGDGQELEREVNRKVAR